MFTVSVLSFGEDRPKFRTPGLVILYGARRVSCDTSSPTEWTSVEKREGVDQPVHKPVVPYFIPETKEEKLPVHEPLLDIEEEEGKVDQPVEIESVGDDQVLLL